MADVWKKGCFAWEYKGKHANLDEAYQQLLQYREALENPPLLVVSDIERDRHPHQLHQHRQAASIELTLDDLLDARRAGRCCAPSSPTRTRFARRADAPSRSPQKAAGEFARLADLLRKYGDDPQRIAHFLIRLLFCLFAEDVGLLPEGLFTRLVAQARQPPGRLRRPAAPALRAPWPTGGCFGADEIAHFDGGLFDDDAALELDGDGLDILAEVSAPGLVGSIEPSIFGTLFERSLDPAKRVAARRALHQRGGHPADRRAGADGAAAPRAGPRCRRRRRSWPRSATPASGRQRAPAARPSCSRLLRGFADELAAVRVLDPACGSGNFLYVALRAAARPGERGRQPVLAPAGLTPLLPCRRRRRPEQLHGIEINPYAHELAQATVWIGYIQWLRENGFGVPAEPILKPLRQHPAAWTPSWPTTTQGRPVEPEWPEADVIIGNPPFLGGKQDAQRAGRRVRGRPVRRCTTAASRREPTWCATGSRKRGR